MWEIIIIFFTTWFLFRKWKNRKLLMLARKLPSVSYRCLPFVGHAYRFLGSDEDRMNVFKTIGRDGINNGGIVKFWFGQRLFVNISDPVIVSQVMSACLAKDETMEFIKEVTGNGLIFAPVHIWRPRRKVMVPAFSTKYLNHFVRVFSRQSEVLRKQLLKVCNKGEFSVWKFLTTYTMDSICETNLGVKIHAQFDPNLPYLQAFDDSMSVAAARVCQPWLQFEWLYKFTTLYSKMLSAKKTMFNFIENVIQQKREELKQKSISTVEADRAIENNEQFKTFLELLIDGSGGSRGYTNLELREEILVLTIAGNDTSAVAGCFTLKMLSKYPEVQEKAYDEIKEVFGESTDEIKPEDLPKLNYLEAVIKESLRLYPPVPVTTRKVDTELHFQNGLTLFPGVSAIINIWAVHRNVNYWGEDAEAFKPERFLESKLSHTASFMPFGYGPRNCVGYRYAMMSLKVVLSTILRHYKVKPSETFKTQNSSTNEDSLRVRFDVMMKDADNFMIRLEERQKF